MLEGNLVQSSAYARVATTAEGAIQAVEILGEMRPGEPFLSPGLTDIQINGFAGINFSGADIQASQLIDLVPKFWAKGVTSLLPTLVTNTSEGFLRGFRTLEQARLADRRLARMMVGYHLEGPYLSPLGAHGAHDPALMHAPDWEEFQAFQAAAGGNIRIVTIAPEWPGSADFIRKATGSGVVVSIGHTDGGPDNVHAAAAAGARLCTHLGNGCAQMLDRHYNPIWAQMVRGELYASLIPDGFHLPTDVVKTFWRMKGPDRIILITDAAHVVLLPPGCYQTVNTKIELLPNGKVIRADGGCLAGSALTMDCAITRFMRLAGASLAEAIHAASATPAALLDSKAICARIEPGQPANLIRFHVKEDGLDVRELMLGGETVYRA